MGNLNSYWQKFVDVIIEYGPKVLLALITLWIGIRLIKFAEKFLKKTFERHNTDVSLSGFLLSLVDWTLKIMLFVSIASMLGIETTSFITIIGAAGLAIGLALQGTLSNFAGGVMLLIFKPYKVGDLIETEGHLGSVESLEIFVTKIITPDNKTVIIPNGPIANGSILNYTTKGKIRVDLVIGVSYNADLKQTKEVLTQTLAKDSRILTDPAPTVAVMELGDSSVNFAVRPWCDPAVYWDVYFDTMEACKIALDDAKIEIPFPQRDLHIISKPEEKKTSKFFS